MTHWKFLNVKGFVWKTVAGWFKLFPYTSLLFSVATASMRCKPKHFFQKMLFLFRKSWSYDQRLLQVYSKLHTFSSTTVMLISTECYFYKMTILTIKDKIIQVTFNNSWTTCTFNNGFLYHKAVTEQIRIKTVLSIATCLQTRLQLQELLQSG